jgi:hypothetical protein
MTLRTMTGPCEPYNLSGSVTLANRLYKSAICSNGLVGVAGQTAPTNLDYSSELLNILL